MAKRIYTRIYTDIHQEIFVTQHAIKQAFARGIAYPEQITNTVRTGRMFRFGKNYARFVSRDGVTCIGEITTTSIVIITVERGNEP